MQLQLSLSSTFSTVIAALIIFTVTGCETGSPFETAATEEPVLDSSNPTSHSDSQTTPGQTTDSNDSTSALPTENTPAADTKTSTEPEQSPNDSESIETEFLPSEWITAPAGHCNQSKNHAYAEYVIDGDTMVLSNGDRVRYIGVDAPELKKKDCWADESRDALMELTPVTLPVCLLKDSKTPDKDSWGRLLRYVFVRHNNQWVMQNARLIRVGAAKAFHKYLKGTDYQSKFIQSENNAHSETLGGWDACQGW